MPRSATNADITAVSSIASRDSSERGKSLCAGWNARARATRYSCLRCDSPQARMAASSASMIASGVRAKTSSSAPTHRRTLPKMVAAAVPLSCWKTIARARERNARLGSCLARRASWQAKMRGNSPQRAMSSPSLGSLVDNSLRASATTTSPKVPSTAGTAASTLTVLGPGLTGEGVAGASGFRFGIPRDPRNAP